MLPLILCRFVQTSAAVVLGGTAVLRLLAWGTTLARPRSWSRLVWGSWSVLVVAGGLQLALTATEMSGQPLSGQVLGTVLNGTSFGGVWKVRAGLIAGVLVTELINAAVSRRGAPSRVSAFLEMALALLAAAVLTTLVWAGHAQASDKHSWLLPVDVVHAVAAGCWPGGLLPLAFLLAAAHRQPRLVDPAVTITRRFSGLSLVAVCLLALSGLLNAVGLVGRISAVWPSVYGRLILCKITLLAAMVGLGAVNRGLLRRQARGDAPQTLQWLWRNVAWECAFALCVLLATETLAMNAPPASAG